MPLPETNSLLEHAHACCRSALLATAVVMKDGRLSTMNPKMAKLLACDDVQWRQQPWRKFFGHQAGATWTHANTADLAVFESVDADWFVKRPGGMRLPVTLWVLPLAQLQQRCYLLMVNSVETLSQQQTSFEHRRALDRITRDIAVKTLLADVAHEINQPLTAITLYATACGRLSATSAQTPPLALMLDQLRQQTLRAGKVLENIQDNVGAVADPLEEVAVNDVVRAAIDSCYDESRVYGVDVSLDLDRSEPCVFGVVQQISALVLNLMTNGLQAMARVNCTYGHQLNVLTERVRDTVDVVVEDQGAGMAEADIQYLVTDSKFDLTVPLGLGLFVCRAIVEQHGGKIIWQPNPRGRGSRVIARLPTSRDR